MKLSMTPASFFLFSVGLSIGRAASSGDDGACASQCDCAGFPVVTCTSAGLTTVPDGIPKNTTQLFLQGNNISDAVELAKGLAGLSQLIYLDLNNNQLTNLQVSTFEDNKKLKYLYLMNNRLLTISSPSVLFGNLAILQLAGNPFRCDCNIKDLFVWLVSTQATVDKSAIECDWPTKGLQLTGLSLSALICDVDECADLSRGGCEHQCVNIRGSYYCQCNPGYQLNGDGKTCSDVDECKTPLLNRCSASCLNFEGSFVCLCPDGQVLSSDQQSCTAADPAFCPPDDTTDAKGTFYWLQASPGATVSLDCPDGSIESTVNDYTAAKATRACTKSGSKATWNGPDTSKCQYASQITRDLKGFSESVTGGNRKTVADSVKEKTANFKDLTIDDVHFATLSLERIVAVDLGSIPENIGKVVVQTVSQLAALGQSLVSRAQTSYRTSNRLLRVLERFGDSVAVSPGSVSVSVLTDQLAVRAVDFIQQDYIGATFLSLLSETNNMQVYYSTQKSPLLTSEVANVQSSIYLPRALLNEIKVTAVPVRIQLSVFHNGNLFVSSNGGARTIPERVVGARVATSGRVTNLENEIEVMIRHKEKKSDEDVQCVYWNPSANGGLGDWDTDGCLVDEIQSGPSLTVCRCNHLTDFSVILRSQCFNESVCAKEISLDVYIGCGVSLTFFCVTFLLIGLIRKQKTSVSMKIQVNFVASCIIALVAFMVGIYRTSPSGVCQAIAAILHFGLLASLTWLITGAFTLYLDQSRARVSWNSSIRKRWIFAWSIPLVVVVSLVIVTNVTDVKIYGGDQYCWIINETVLIAGFYSPPTIVFLLNITLHILTRRAMGKNSSALMLLRLRTAIAILFLFLLTWASGSLMVFGLFNDHLAFRVLFIVFVIILAGAIFLLQCLVNPGVRRKVGKVLCTEKHYSYNDGKSGKTSRTSLDSYRFAGYHPQRRIPPVGRPSMAVDDLDAFYAERRYNPAWVSNETYGGDRRKDIWMDAGGRVLYRPPPVGREQYYGEGEEPELGEEYVHGDGIESWWSPSTTGLDREDGEYLFKGRRQHDVDWEAHGRDEANDTEGAVVNFM
eukprot:m.111368 g.111368  ORF g.111368 m.111368 type:complete len:1074 (+) comp37425_c0_seq2:36-3257(+)